MLDTVVMIMVFKDGVSGDSVGVNNDYNLSRCLRFSGGYVYRHTRPRCYGKGFHKELFSVRSFRLFPLTG